MEGVTDGRTSSNQYTPNNYVVRYKKWSAGQSLTSPMLRTPEEAACCWLTLSESSIPTKTKHRPGHCIHHGMCTGMKRMP